MPLSGARSDIADWPSLLRSRPMRTCFLSSPRNAIGGSFAPLNGVRSGYPAKMSSRLKWESPRRGLSGTQSSTTDVEELSQIGRATIPVSITLVQLARIQTQATAHFGSVRRDRNRK
jgi:hypothetical protein